MLFSGRCSKRHQRPFTRQVLEQLLKLRGVTASLVAAEGGSGGDAFGDCHARV